MSADTLTDADVNALRRARDRWWVPVGDGMRLAERGWLIFHATPISFDITAAGREALARYDAANDDVSRGAACHTGEAGDRRGR